MPLGFRTPISAASDYRTTPLCDLHTKDARDRDRMAQKFVGKDLRPNDLMLLLKAA